jgi:hypothetical protein
METLPTTSPAAGRIPGRQLVIAGLVAALLGASGMYGLVRFGDGRFGYTVFIYMALMAYVALPVVTGLLVVGIVRMYRARRAFSLADRLLWAAGALCLAVGALNVLQMLGSLFMRK